MSSLYREFLDERSGATSIEYALIAALVSIVIVGSVIAVGDSLNGVFAVVVAGFG